MVHALKETWRVLVPGGTMIDLRPHTINYPFEVVTAEQTRLAGMMNLMDFEDTLASDDALAQVTREGWFVREREDFFHYAHYWDTVYELKTTIIEDDWNDPQSADLLARAERFLDDGGPDAQIRLRYRMIISRYRKHGNTPQLSANPRS